LRLLRARGRRAGSRGGPARSVGEVPRRAGDRPGLRGPQRIRGDGARRARGAPGRVLRGGLRRRRRADARRGRRQGAGPGRPAPALRSSIKPLPAPPLYAGHTIGRRRAYDPKTLVGTVPDLVAARESEDWPPPEPGDVRHARAGREARARDPVLQAPLNPLRGAPGTITIPTWPRYSRSTTTPPSRSSCA